MKPIYKPTEVLPSNVSSVDKKNSKADVLSGMVKIILILMILAAVQLMIHSNAFGSIPNLTAQASNPASDFFKMDVSWTLTAQLMILLLVAICSREKFLQ